LLFARAKGTMLPFTQEWTSAVFFSLPHRLQGATFFLVKTGEVPLFLIRGNGALSTTLSWLFRLKNLFFAPGSTLFFSQSVLVGLSNVPPFLPPARLALLPLPWTTYDIFFFLFPCKDSDRSWSFFFLSTGWWVVTAPSSGIALPPSWEEVPFFPL